MPHNYGNTVQTLVSDPTGMGVPARLALAYLERKHIDPDPLLKRCGLERASLEAGKRIKLTSQIAFLSEVGEAVGNEWLGLDLADEVDLREMGMIYYVTASSHTFEEALRRLMRYVRLGNEALVLQMDQGAICRVTLSYSGVARHRDRHQTEFLTMVLLRLCRKLLGQHIVPVSASFVHHRIRDLGAIRKRFGCDVAFDAFADQLSFDGTLLERPIVGDDPHLNELMVKLCEDALAVRASNVSAFRTLVENTIAPLLPHAEANAAIVARRLGLSERTFARRLAADGVSFGEILDGLRREMALDYLQEGLQVSQIAWLLGFGQLSSFSHACRRWTGKCPSEHRRASKQRLIA
ncbi:AraC family transcriptional regulator [Phyllobacterium chamaecytisi]|uniref:AraC family transcriptional regulator n=1 Tax=Phyllobacterium chamaecytisi TaxID=2876082 RepID=UPI001CCA9502|nr:AraC family transcriptional regulator [Phyllobacterium sp. KW56]MBZ9605684.1 AraC family transcriptional regulator [Phyllobacterium sp. KW56]